MVACLGWWDDDVVISATDAMVEVQDGGRISSCSYVCNWVEAYALVGGGDFPFSYTR